jgi:hypothetical protein
MNEINYDDSSDEYIDVSELVKSQLQNIYQIQLNNDNVIIKQIGTGTDVPDIIIKETFGKKNNLNMYNCVYTEKEIDFLKTENNSEKLLPIIKLIETTDTKNIYSLSIKFNNSIHFNEYTHNFTIYLTYSINTEYFYTMELQKTINSNNIIETFIEKMMDCGFNIF